MDHVGDLRMEPKELADHAFRFLKVPARLLLGKTAQPRRATSIPQDLADLLARSGIDLIAERIESESMVLDLLDYDVRFGQGFLFSPPRPVRAEALQAGRGRGRDAAGRTMLAAAGFGRRRDSHFASGMRLTVFARSGTRAARTRNDGDAALPPLLPAFLGARARLRRAAVRRLGRGA